MIPESERNPDYNETYEKSVKEQSKRLDEIIKILVQDSKRSVLQIPADTYLQSIDKSPRDFEYETIKGQSRNVYGIEFGLNNGRTDYKISGEVSLLINCRKLNGIAVVGVIYGQNELIGTALIPKIRGN